MRRAHISAEIDWLSTSDGGRTSPIFTGYRGQFHLYGADNIADVEWRFPGESVDPGASTVCEVWFARPERHLPRITIGDRFEVREGARVVGRGKITSFLGRDVR